MLSKDGPSLAYAPHCRPLYHSRSISRIRVSKCLFYLGLLTGAGSGLGFGWTSLFVFQPPRADAAVGFVLAVRILLVPPFITVVLLSVGSPL